MQRFRLCGFRFALGWRKEEGEILVTFFSIGIHRMHQKYLMDEEEALVVCSDKNLGIGITIWDLGTGDHLLHIPTCASIHHGLICLRNQYLVASQIQKPGSFGGGVIFKWPLNKYQTTLRSYLMEAIGPLACTNDGTYLVGGASSGNIYIWEVSTGRLLKQWCAHRNSLSCMTFSKDNSILISGSEDGTIAIWSTVNLLGESNRGCFPSTLSFSTDHKAAITGLLSLCCNLYPFFISSSLDGTYKIWNMVTGKALRSQAFPLPITAIVLDTTANILFFGFENGNIAFNKIHVGLLEDPYFNPDSDQIVLSGHRKSVTTLIFSKSGLISASEDCTICIWDVNNRMIIRRLNHLKGPVTNLVIIPKSSLIPLKNHQRISNRFHISTLEKTLHPIDLSQETITLLPSYRDEQEQTSWGYRSSNLLNQDMIERWRTKAAVRMKVETNREYEMSAVNMTKHTMEINKYLKSSLLDLLQYRLQRLPSDSKLPKIKR